MHDLVQSRLTDGIGATLLGSLAIPFFSVLTFSLFVAGCSGGWVDVQMIDKMVGLELPQIAIVFDASGKTTLAAEAEHIACSRVVIEIDRKTWPAFGSYPDHYEGPGTYWKSSPDIYFGEILGQRLPRWLYEKYYGKNELKCPVLHAFLPYPIQFILPFFVMAVSCLVAKNLSRRGIVLSLLSAGSIYCLVMVHPFDIPLDLLVNKLTSSSRSWLLPAFSLCFTLVPAILTKRILSR